MEKNHLLNTSKHFVTRCIIASSNNIMEANWIVYVFHFYQQIFRGNNFMLDIVPGTEHTTDTSPVS